MAPPSSRASAHAASVAPVVMTSSTRRIQRPRRSGARRAAAANAPATLVARSRPVEVELGDRGAPALEERRTGRPRWRAADRAMQLGLVVAARAARDRRGPGHGRRRPPRPRSAAQRRATAAPSGSPRRCSPPYLMRCRASRTSPRNGAHQSSCSRGAGISPGKPDRYAAREVQSGVERGRAGRADRRTLGVAADTRAGKATSSSRRRGAPIRPGHSDRCIAASCRRHRLSITSRVRVSSESHDRDDLPIEPS